MSITPPQSIVFPYDPLTKRFISAYYDPVLTGDLIDAQDISKFLREVEQLIRTFSQGLITPFFRVCYILLMIMLIATGATVPVLRECLDEKDVVAVVYVLISICFTGFVVLLYAGLKASANKKKNLKIIEEKIEELAKENASVFEQQGYCWTIPNEFPRWIQLSKRSLQDRQDLESQRSNSTPLEELSP